MSLENVASLTLGELVRFLRKRTRLTQQQFADQLEKSRRSIIDWEAGTSRPQSKGDLLDIARVLQLNEEDTTLLLKAAGQDPLPHVWNIPYLRNSYFTGREPILERLANELFVSRPLTVSKPLALTGLGGIGKSQIALEYSYRFYLKYHAVLWVEASSRDKWIASYVALAELLNLPEKDVDDQARAVQAVKLWLQSHSQWLLLLDDVDDLSLMREFLPHLHKGHILLTTRAQAMGGLAYAIEIERMEEESSLLFLLYRASLLVQNGLLESMPAANIAVAREICEELGGLPLALDQAGAYLEETHCGLAQYLKLYRAHRLVLLQRRGGLASDHPEPVATTWSLSFERVEQRSPAAADLLRVCAFLHCDAIPDELIHEMITTYTLYLCPSLLPVTENPLLLNEMITVLRAYSLIRRLANESLLSIHQLVQAVLKDTMDKELFQAWAKQMVCAVGQAFPDVTFDNWRTCERFLPHALACVTLIEQEQMTSLEDALVVYRAGIYLVGRHRLSEAEPLLQRSLAICEGELGPSHPLTAKNLSDLASLYQLQGRYDQAESLFQRAITLFETELGKEDPVIIGTLNQLAMLYHRQGKYRQAMPLLWRAYFLSLQAFGPLHFSVARCLVQLATLHQAQDELDEAETLYHQALTLSEQLLGSDHPYVAVCLNNLSIVYRIQKKYIQAEQLLTRAFSICEKTYDPDDPFAAKCLGHLAEIYHLQGKDGEAEPLFQRVLLMLESRQGSHHPDVAIALNYLADFYIDQSRFTQAEPLLRRAVAIGEELGATNPELVTHLKDYASLLQKMGQDEDARRLAARAKRIVEDACEAMPSQPEKTRDGLYLTAHEVFMTLDHVWNQAEEALKKQLTDPERTRVERVKQVLWLLLEDMEAEFKPERSVLSSERGAEREQELAELLQQPPFIDLHERPDLRHVPGIGYVPDDFPFDSQEDMAASHFWSGYSLRGFIGYTHLLVLLRHFHYVSLSKKDKAAVRELQKTISGWSQGWLEGPLPEVTYTGPSEIAIKLDRILQRKLFRKKYEEIQQISESEILGRLHPDDILLANCFRSTMAERFESVKEELIEDLKKMGKIPRSPSNNQAEDHGDRDLW